MDLFYTKKKNLENSPLSRLRAQDRRMLLDLGGGELDDEMMGGGED